MILGRRLTRGLVSTGQLPFVGVGAYGLFVFVDIVRIEPLTAVAATAAVALVVAAITSIFAFCELLADYGAAYLAALGLMAMAVVVVAPRGLWGLVESRVPAPFAIQRRLVVSPAVATDPAEEPERT